MNQIQSDILHNIEVIQSRIRHACEKAGREVSSVRLLLATKTVDPSRIRMAIESGHTLIGENKVQEFASKADELSDLDYERHFIGHLQSNKVKEVLKYAHVIQTVDSLSLASELEKRLTELGRKLDIMIQVNTSFEESKFGLAPEDVLAFVEEIINVKTLNIIGLMTIGLFADTAEEARPSYRLLKAIGEEINATYPGEQYIKEYSMGMSGDLEVAIEEGATMVRVGSAVFGPRIYM